MALVELRVGVVVNLQYDPRVDQGVMNEQLAGLEVLAVLFEHCRKHQWLLFAHDLTVSPRVSGPPVEVRHGA